MTKSKKDVESLMHLYGGGSSALAVFEVSDHDIDRNPSYRHISEPPKPPTFNSGFSKIPYLDGYDDDGFDNEFTYVAENPFEAELEAEIEAAVAEIERYSKPQHSDAQLEVGSRG